MEVETLHTERCILRPVTLDDADWLFRLFNDPDVVTYIEGINWFNADVASVRSFIESMQINAEKDLGVMWCVEYQSYNIGFILAYDLKDKPFLTFALLPEYRNKHFCSEVFTSVNDFISKTFSAPKTETENPIVKKILQHHSEVLYN